MKLITEHSIYLYSKFNLISKIASPPNLLLRLPCPQNFLYFPYNETLHCLQLNILLLPNSIPKIFSLSKTSFSLFSYSFAINLLTILMVTPSPQKFITTQNPNNMKPTLTMPSSFNMIRCSSVRYYPL